MAKNKIIFGIYKDGEEIYTTSFQCDVTELEDVLIKTAITTTADNDAFFFNILSTVVAKCLGLVDIEIAEKYYKKMEDISEVERLKIDHSNNKILS